MRSTQTDDKGHLVWHLSDWASLQKEELYRILRLRQEVFVLEQYCPFVDNDDWDQHGAHLWVCGPSEKSVLGYSRILPPNTLYKEASLGRVVVDRSARGGQLGLQLPQFFEGLSSIPLSALGSCIAPFERNSPYPHQD